VALGFYTQLRAEELEPRSSPRPRRSKIADERTGRLGCCRQDQEVPQSAQSTIRNPLRPPQCHHNCVAVPRVWWRLTNVGDLKNRLDSAYGSLWQRTAGFRTDLKIMVSPVRIRVPPLIKACK
jgi:hypothetical protein